MSAMKSREHRSQVARVVYLAQDRLDLDVAACEAAKTMATPRVGDEMLIKRNFVFSSPKAERSPRVLSSLSMYRITSAGDVIS